MNRSQDPLNWLGTIGIGLLVMIMSVNNVNLCKSLLCQQKKPIAKSILYSSIITICSFFLCAIIQFITSIMVLNGNTDPTTLFLMADFSALFYAFGGHSTMLFVFVLRIDVAFRNTFIAYSKCTIRTLYAMSISLYFITIALITITLSQIFTVILEILLISTWMLLDISLSITLMILFIRKIGLIIKLEQKTISSGTDVTQEKPDNELMYPAIKHSVLVTMSISTTFICIVMAMIILFVIDDEEGYSIKVDFWMTLDSCITSICISLLFRFNKSLYDRLCFKCHKVFTRNRSGMDFQGGIRGKKNKDGAEDCASKTDSKIDHLPSVSSV